MRAESRAVSSGRRDRLIELEALQSATPGASGFPVEDWQPLAAVFASKEDPTVRERFTADQLSASADGRWEIPYREDMDPDAVEVAKVRRLIYEGRVYRITGAQHLGRREGIALFTLAKVG